MQDTTSEDPLCIRIRPREAFEQEDISSCTRRIHSAVVHIPGVKRQAELSRRGYGGETLGDGTGAVSARRREEERCRVTGRMGHVQLMSRLLTRGGSAGFARRLHPLRHNPPHAASLISGTGVLIYRASNKVSHGLTPGSLGLEY
ncbi:hypothetical protein Bbelb_182590 [Branchiostoma belcheri]|nr:hypothetical protein Bbelb_182590 [Branchiostoma belcheri]